MRKILGNNNASAVPIILFVLAIVGCGALYTLFFIFVGYPYIDTLGLNDTTTTSLMMTLFYAIPMIILIVGVISLIKAGLKRGVYQ